MKTMILLALSILAIGVVTGCEHERAERRQGASGGPGVGYEQNTGGDYINRGIVEEPERR